MSLTNHQLSQLLPPAVAAARAAGEVIAAHRGKGIEADHKAVGTSAASQVVTEVDHKAQAAILEILEPTRGEHDLALLTEESTDDGSRLKKPAFWSIDPMDGTLAFVNDTPGFSVSIALVARDGTPLIGVVYDPVEEVLYHAVRGQGAYRNDQPLNVPELDPNRPLVLRTDYSFQKHPWLERTREGLEEIAEQLGLNGTETRFHIGAVMNACRVLEHPNHCYFKYPRTGDSGGSLWDYAATACLFHEAGAIACDIHGNPMELNRADSTFMNHRGLLYAGIPSLAARITQLNKYPPPQ